jgi:anti-anti-sigma factor
MESVGAIMINLPENFGAKEAKKLCRELKAKISKDAPCVIVDLSRVKRMDTEGLEGLLSCMEEVAKHDGAVQLGAVSPEAATILELARIDHLFEKFPSVPAHAPSFAVAPNLAEEIPADGVVQPQAVVA